MARKVCRLHQRVSVPISLYKSEQGLYFTGYADNLVFGNGTGAWAGLYNPLRSGVNLHLDIWTVADITDSPFRAQIWFNANPPGRPAISPFVTPANTAIAPLPVPQVRLMQASSVNGFPLGGVKAFARRGLPETTIIGEENGKFIFPPGGLFMVFLSNPESPDLAVAGGRVAFGWWEEPIC